MIANVVLLLVLIIGSAYPKKNYLPAFRSYTQEEQHNNLKIIGNIPSWLNGTLVQTGPAKHAIGKDCVNLWFDGFALLQRYNINNGIVSYANKFVESTSYTYSRKKNKIRCITYGTDPKASFFSNILSAATNSDPTDNPTMGLTCYEGKPTVHTETPEPIVYDPATLKTRNHLPFHDSVQGQACGAYPHYDPETEKFYNYTILFSLSTRMFYTVYSHHKTSMQRESLISFPVKAVSYMHTTAMTEKYLILPHIPLETTALKLARRSKSFGRMLKWKPQKGTNFIIVNRHTGERIADIKAESFFYLHTINAFEYNNTIIIDLVAYDDPSIMESYDLTTLYDAKTITTFPYGHAKRFMIDLANKHVTSRMLCPQTLVWPCINYDFCNAKPYRYIYGLHQTRRDDHPTDIIRFDIASGETATWHEDLCYPSRPTFVQQPIDSESERHEDDGILMTSVFDAKTNTTFLLILDAHDMKELARAYLSTTTPWPRYSVFYTP